MRLTRAPYVLLHPGDNSGCGFHRMLRPLQLMQSVGVAFGQHHYQFIQEHYVKALNPDVIVFQRQADDSHIELMKKYREILPNAFFVYEIDDVLSAVPEKSWHFPYMPPGIDKRLAKAIPNCDAITVTTRELAEHMRKIVDEKIDVRVVPNMLGRDDLMKCDAVRKQIPRKLHSKFRIGWGGGIGHIGDLEMLNPVFEALKDEVEWVFLGMNPETKDGVLKEFRGGTTPDQYLVNLAAMDVDLMIAPLEDNYFNRCKSNLRLLESGACGAPVIASPVTPYLLNSPPVKYATTTEEWIAAIREFIAMDAPKRIFEGEKLRRWVERNYILEERAEERIKAWLPQGVRPFMPKNVRAQSRGVMIISETPVSAEISKLGTVVDSFAAAIAQQASTADIVYLRPGITVTADQIKRTLAIKGDDNATVSVACNEAGPCGFPKMQDFSPMDTTNGDVIDGICKDMPTTIELPACAGPVIVIRRTAIDRLGWPSVGEKEIPDLGIVEWSANAALVGYKNIGNFGVFVRLEKPLVFQAVDINRAVMRVQMRWPNKKIDESKFAEIREKLEVRFHKETYKILPSQNPSDYSTWIDQLDTPGPRSLEAMSKWMEGKPTICIKRFSGKGDLFKDTQTDWVVFVPLASKLSPYLAAGFLDAIEKNPNADIIYADHDYLDPQGKRQGHWFKGGFDLHFLLGNDYITQCVALRRDAGWNIDSPEWTQEQNLFAHILWAANKNRDRIAHYPRILCHVQVPLVDNLKKSTDERIAVINTLAPQFHYPITAAPHGAGMGMVSLTYTPVTQEKVSIIVPTKNNVEMLTPCIATLLRITKYQNFEIIVVDNGSTRKEMIDYLAGLNDPRVKVVSWPEQYNWSKLNNWAARNHATGSILCFLNDDTRVLAPNWLEEMVGAAQFPGVGAVGARLLYAHGVVQHVGVVSHKGYTGHIHKGTPQNYIGYHGLNFISHENSAVTGACMLVSRTNFDFINGFDESMAHNFNDVAFCIELRRQLKLVNVVSTKAELQHLEGATRITAATDEGKKILIDDTAAYKERYPEEDPYWNPNLTMAAFNEGIFIVGLNYDILNWKPEAWPWWSRDKAFNRSVLVIGSQDGVVHERHDGVSLYQIAPQGIYAKMISPPMDNFRLIDIRHPEKAKQMILNLGVEEIIITGLGDASPLLLGFLTRLDLPIIYRPLNAESLCPRGDLKVDGKTCGQGWKTNSCQQCIDAHGSHHGYVSMVAWISEWVRFLNDDKVTIDGSFIGDAECTSAISDVYGGGSTAGPKEDVRAA